MQQKINNSILSLIKGDITVQNMDAIVNAADPSLMGGGGVDGAIHFAAGPDIHKECIQIAKKIGGTLPFGKAVLTKGYMLPAKYVIHTVGPIWKGGKKNEPELLRDCYMNSLKLAVENSVKTIAFPSISTGAFGYPEELAVPIALRAVEEFLKENSNINEVIFVLFSDETFDKYKKALEEL